MIEQYIFYIVNKWKKKNQKSYFLNHKKLKLPINIIIFSNSIKLKFNSSF